MKKKFNSKSALLLISLFSGSSYAQDYYVCNTGSNNNSGKSPYQPWQTFNYAMSKFATLYAGDSILFCRNGNFTSSSPILYNFRSRSDNPITIADYVAPDANTNKTDKPPIITGSSNTGILNFQDSGNADHDEGYVVKNLTLKGTGLGIGIFMFNDVDSLTMENLDISGFSIGVYSAFANQPNPGANRVNDNISLSNSLITNNSGQGWLGSCSNCIIDNNKFTNNGFGQKVFNHNIYISANFATTNITVSNNTLYQSTLVNGKCAGVSLVAHGVLSDLTIKGNTVYEDLGAVEQGCWGIAVDPGYGSEESFKNVSIENNKVTNVGNIGIGCASCTDSQIVGNTIIHAQDFVFTGIKVPDRTEDSVKSDRIEISGNYIDLKDPYNKGKTGVITNGLSGIHVGVNQMFYSN